MWFQKEIETVGYASQWQQHQMENVPPYDSQKITLAQMEWTRVLRENDAFPNNRTAWQHTKEDSMRCFNGEENKGQMVNLTCENLRNSCFHSSFPLISGSACTHSLTTPSIGTLTSDEYDIVEDLSVYSDSASTVPSKSNSSINSAVQESVTNVDALTEITDVVNQETMVQESNETAEMTFTPYRLFGTNALTTAVQSWLKQFEAEIRAK